MVCAGPGAGSGAGPWSEAVAVDVVDAAADAGVPGSLLVVPLPHPTNTTTAASATEAAARRLGVAGGVLTGAEQGTDQHRPVGVVGLGFELVLPVGEPAGVRRPSQQVGVGARWCWRLRT